MKSKKLMRKLILTSTCAIMPLIATAGPYPFPRYPIVTQSYLNRSTPLMFAYVDNSTTMKTDVDVRDLISKKTLINSDNRAFAPDRLDLVKNALYRMADDYFYDFKWGIYVIRDDQRPDVWEAFSKEDLGYIDGILPIWKRDPINYAWLEKIPANRRSYFIKDRPYRKDKTAYRKGGSTNEKNGIYLAQWANAPASTDKNFNEYGHPMRFAPNYVPNEAAKQDLFDNIKSISPTSSASYMHNSFPQMLNQNFNGFTGYNQGDSKSIRDMLSIPNFVEYRCQDIFVIAFADGNRVNDKENKESARWAALNHPIQTPNATDLEGKPFNGPDFPNQHIFTGAVGVVSSLNKTKFINFTNAGAGAANDASTPKEDPFNVISENADEIGDFLEDFMESKRPRSFFSATAPASVAQLKKKGNQQDDKRLVINLQIEANRWASYLKMKMVNDTQGTSNEDARALYSQDIHKVIGQSPATGKWLNLTTSSPKTLMQHFSNQSLGINDAKGEAQFLRYLPWLITSTSNDKDTGYRSRAMTDSRVPGAQDRGSQNEFRYTGGGLNTNILQVGERDEKSRFLPYLIYGSNDGMLKIYTANDSEQTPYTYALGLMPGNMVQKDRNSQTKQPEQTIYQSVYLRSRADFGKSDTNPHNFGVNGGIGSRLTNNGQLIGISALGQGGKGIVAFNIAGIDEISHEKVGVNAPSNTWEKSIPLWTSDENSETKENMAYVTGSPIIAPIILTRNGQENEPSYNDVFQAIFTSYGLSSNDGHDTIAIINTIQKNFGSKPSQNMVAGQLIAKFSIPSTLSKEESGFSSPAVIDLNLDGIADVAYVGNRAGDLYRLDMRYNTIEEWKLVKVFSGNADYPIALAPVASKNPEKPNSRMVTFTTGSSLYSKDIVNQKAQKIVTFEDTLLPIPEVVTYDQLRSNTTKEDSTGYVDGIPTPVFERSIIVDTTKPDKDYKGWALSLPTEFQNKHFKGKELGNIGMSVVGQSLFVTTNSLKVDSFANITDGTPVVCFRDLTNKGGSVMSLNLRDGGLPNKKDLHIAMSDKPGGPTHVISGYVTNDITSPLLVTGATRTYVTDENGMFSLFNELAEPGNKLVAAHVIKGNRPYSGTNAFISRENKCSEQNYKLAVSIGDETLIQKLKQDCFIQLILKRRSWHEV